MPGAAAGTSCRRKNRERDYHQRQRRQVSLGSITSQEVADQLKEQLAVDIDKRKIDLKEPIKSLGSYSVTARIHPEVHVTFKVEVVPE